MRSNRIVSTAAFVSLLLVGSDTARAKDAPKSPVGDLMEQAKASASQDALKAATLFGQAIELAQRSHDVRGEEAAADAVEEFVDGLESSDRRAEGAGTTADASKPSSRAAIAALMKELDPKRNGLFVSAHALATVLLRGAVAHGDGAFVGEAAAALVAHEKSPKSGAAAASLARFGEGMAAAKAGDDAKASAALSAAYDAFAANGWLALALDVSTELAATHLRAKDEAKAAAIVAKAAGLVSDGSDFDAVQTWLANGRTRWKGAPPAVLAPFDAVAAKHGAGGVSAKGGEGGEGGEGGKAGVNVSDVGRFLSKAGADKAFLAVTRAKEGWSFRPAYRKDAVTRPLAPGQTTWHDGGVTCVLYDASIALHMIDLEGLEGQPGGRSRPSSARAFYWLAPGETFSATKGGTAQIAGK